MRYSRGRFSVAGDSSSSSFQADQFRETLERDHDVPTGHPKSRKLFDLAWEYGHSYGLDEVANYYSDLWALVGEKPGKTARSAYDYHDARNFLQARDGYDERNHAGRRFTGEPNDPPYRDFWHYIVERYEIHNGCYITLRADFEAKPWQQEIIGKYLDTFGESDDSGEVCAEFWVEW